MPWHVGLAFFSIAAAVLVVGGAIFLRFQRDRYHFLLMKAALEKGITAFPESVPAWLISMRIGVIALALGLGLACTGLLLYVSADALDKLPASVARQASDVPLPPGYAAAPAPQPPEENRQLPPPRDELRPRPNPEMERWIRIQTQRAAGIVAASIGGILTLLGIVRILFARLEKRYMPPPTHS
jgi:hypothetical protein